ncbi:MAG: rhodanese-like domain-containing protein [Acidimicrobiia bacterium]|nr:rhodanese-like domain-containing protein [Acidimicrobiia bacterium]NNL28289.1 rhodanese-like domain-containing protein [Acidimicrobiia bacterium]
MYAGDVHPHHAAEALTAEEDAVLVDVRTPGEWALGVPDHDEVKLVSWQFPDGTPNPDFLDQLAEAGIRPDQAIYFLCRSGVRSQSAAMAATAHGFHKAYNVAGGFEGKHPTPGWRDLLPWRVPPPI